MHMPADAAQNMCAQLCARQKYAGGFCSGGMNSARVLSRVKLNRFCRCGAHHIYNKLKRFECRRGSPQECAFAELTVDGLMRLLCMLGGVRSPRVVRVRVAIGVLLWTTSTTDAALYAYGEVDDGLSE